MFAEDRTLRSKYLQPFFILASVSLTAHTVYGAGSLELLLELDGDCASQQSVGRCVDIKNGSETLATYHTAPEPSRSIGALFTQCRPPNGTINVCAQHSGMVPPQLNICTSDGAQCIANPICDACGEVCSESHADIFAHEAVELNVLKMEGPRVSFDVSSTHGSWHGGSANCAPTYPFPVAITWAATATQDITFLSADLSVSIPPEGLRQIAVARPLPFFEVMQEMFDTVHWVDASCDWSSVPVPDAGLDSATKGFVTFVDREPLCLNRRVTVATQDDSYSVGILACDNLSMTLTSTELQRDLVVSSFTEQQMRPNLYLHPDPTNLLENEGLEVSGRVVLAISSMANRDDLETAMRGQCPEIFADGFESGETSAWTLTFLAP